MNRLSKLCLWAIGSVLTFVLLSAVSLAEDPDLSEAEVTIIQGKKGQRVEEYRISGQLYLIKVVPAVGPPYFLFDQNGDGEFNLQDDDPTANLPTSQWKLFEWN